MSTHQQSREARRKYFSKWHGSFCNDIQYLVAASPGETAHGRGSTHPRNSSRSCDFNLHVREEGTFRVPHQCLSVRALASSLYLWQLMPGN
jgi:hypothetical protein